MRQEPASPHSLSIELVGDDVRASRQAYRALLGTPDVDSFTVDNAAVRVESGEGDRGHRVVFGTDDYEATSRLWRRRGLALTEAAAGRALAEREPVGISAGVERLSHVGPDITAIDHLVFDAPTRDGAVALFGATLGLDFRLEQAIFDDAIQLFFRGPAVVIEVLVRRDAPEQTTLWGIAWRSEDIDATHGRLNDEGLALSPIRDGRKPGTRVFSVKETALVVPTLVIS
ncbi:VOC family protein [Aldersonia kunmingensis]|uniref:VOC family protein n=1 Tax=Aldersonia kunmingensis TaxID=408066 RepID=UPI00083447B1|nr:hypothetical protein [Aldersonia kunmingensis]